MSAIDRVNVLKASDMLSAEIVAPIIRSNRQLEKISKNVTVSPYRYPTGDWLNSAADILRPHCISDFYPLHL